MKLVSIALAACILVCPAFAGDAVSSLGGPLALRGRRRFGVQAACRRVLGKEGGAVTGNRPEIRGARRAVGRLRRLPFPHVRHGGSFRSCRWRDRRRMGLDHDVGEGWRHGNKELDGRRHGTTTKGDNRARRLAVAALGGEARPGRRGGSALQTSLTHPGAGGDPRGLPPRPSAFRPTRTGADPAKGAPASGWVAPPDQTDPANCRPHAHGALTCQVRRETCRGIPRFPTALPLLARRPRRIRR